MISPEASWSTTPGVHPNQERRGPYLFGPAAVEAWRAIMRETGEVIWHVGHPDLHAIIGCQHDVIVATALKDGQMMGCTGVALATGDIVWKVAPSGLYKMAKGIMGASSKAAARMSRHAVGISGERVYLSDSTAIDIRTGRKVDPGPEDQLAILSHTLSPASELHEKGGTFVKGVGKIQVTRTEKGLRFSSRADGQAEGGKAGGKHAGKESPGGRAAKRWIWSVPPSLKVHDHKHAWTIAGDKILALIARSSNAQATLFAVDLATGDAYPCVGLGAWQDFNDKGWFRIEDADGEGILLRLGYQTLAYHRIDKSFAKKSEEDSQQG